MRFTRSFLLILLPVISDVSASTGQNNYTLQTSNATHSLGVPELPKLLRLDFEIGGPRLHKTACLLNVIAALRQLALGDWDAKVIDGTKYLLNEYPQVIILVNTRERKRNIPAKYVVSAITLGVLQMANQKKFELAQFLIEWDSTVLGWVHIVNNPSTSGLTISGGDTNDTLGTAKRSEMQSPSNRINPEDVYVTNVVSIDIAEDAEERRLKTTFTPIGTHLGVFDIIIPIMNSLADMAQYVITRRASGLVATYEGYKGVVCILDIRPDPTTQPFMSYEWLIRTISRIPAFMVEEHRFGELEIEIEVDGVDIAYGRLTHVPDGCLSAHSL